MLISALHLILSTDNPSGYCSRPKVYPRSWSIFLRICTPIQSALDGQVSDWFSISAGVRQGCAVAPHLFFGTDRVDNQSLRSPRLRMCEPGSGSVHRSGLCWRCLCYGWNVGGSHFSPGDHEWGIVSTGSWNQLEQDQDTSLRYHRWRPTWYHHLRPCIRSIWGWFLRLSRFIGWCQWGKQIWYSSNNELARTCMKSLDRGIWRSSVSLTKLRLYNVYILPVLLTHGVWQKRRDNVLMLLTNGAYAVFFASHILHTLLTYRYRVKPTNPRFPH